MHDCTNHEMDKNESGGRKVVGQATTLIYWAQIVGGRLSILPVQ